MSSSNRYRKFILRFFSAFAAFYFLFFDFVMPASAGLTTVDSYLEQHPDQASLFAAELNVNTSAAGSLAAAESAVPVQAQVLDAAGRVIATTFNGTTTMATGINPFVVVGAGAAGIALGSLGKSAIDSVRARATNHFCLANPNHSVCAGTYRITYGSTWYKPSNSPGYDDVPYFVHVTQQCTPLNNGTGDGYMLLSNGYKPIFRGMTCSVNIAKIADSPTTTKFTDLTQAQRDDAISRLDSKDYRDAIAQAVPKNLAPATGKFPPGAKKLRITSPGLAPVGLQDSDGDGKLDRRYATGDSVEVDIPASMAPVDGDADADGSPDLEDADDDNDGTPDVSDATPKGEQPVVPENSPITATKFSGENWLQHGVTVFSKKFPFDMFGTIQGTSVNECPKYTFFNHDFELCPVRDFFVMLKYPFIIAFMVWSFQQI